MPCGTAWNIHGSRTLHQGSADRQPTGSLSPSLFLPLASSTFFLYIIIKYIGICTKCTYVLYMCYMCICVTCMYSIIYIYIPGSPDLRSFAAHLRTPMKLLAMFSSDITTFILTGDFLIQYEVTVITSISTLYINIVSVYICACVCV